MTYGGADESDLIGTRKAAELLHWHQRKVQRVIRDGLAADTLPIKVVKVGGRSEYVLHRADLPVLEAYTAPESTTGRNTHD